MSRDDQAPKSDGESPTAKSLGFATRAIHAGQEPDPLTGAVVTPIHLASTFAQQAVGKHQGFDYPRTNNPTRASLETTIASLEGADHAFAFSSGMAAVDTVLRTLRPGDHLLIPNDAYGGTYRLVASVYAPTGVKFTPVDLRSPEAVRAAWRNETRLVWVETPSNPKLHIIDIEAVAAIAHAKGARCIVDNTFATRTSNSRSVSARTLSSTRRRSTWGDTRTWSADWSPRATRSWRHTSDSSRTRQVRCRARSTVISSNGAEDSRRCGSTASARTHAWSRCTSSPIQP